MRRVFAIWLLGVLLAACSSDYRVEPLNLEPRSMVKKVILSYDEEQHIPLAETTVVAFVKAMRAGNCALGWGLMTTRFQQGFVKVAGSEEAAFGQFCSGYRFTRDSELKAVDWTTAFVGMQPHFVTTPPPEVGIQVPEGEHLYFVVQRDGTYTSFIMLATEVGDDQWAGRIEPF